MGPFAVIILLFSTILILYKWLTFHYSYWRRNGIPHIPATPILGNMTDILFFKTSPGGFFHNVYNHQIAKERAAVGIYVFHKPALVIKDPEMIKTIFVKDFNLFSNRYATSDPHSDTLGGYSLFFIKNPAWKEVRSKITPVFTSGKIKQMYKLISNIGIQLDDHLNSLTTNSGTNSVVIELKELSALFTIDVIASVAYGVEANSLKNPEGDFPRNGRNIFKFSIYRAIEFSSMFFLPQIVSIFKFKLFSESTSEFIKSSIQHIMEIREKSGVIRNDLIDILVNLRKVSKLKHDKNESTFDENILLAQAAAFFSAGFDTAAATMSFTLYELSKKPDIQNKLRQEIKNVLLGSKGELTYEDVQNMKYLDMIISETLRMYPPLPFLDRECILSEGTDSYSLDPAGKIEVLDGMPVYVPIQAIQMDPKYFPNPDDFNPERFAPENKDQIIPYTYMPFGMGPHECIGKRFGLLQTKIGLISFLRNHFVEPSENSQSRITFNKRALMLQADGGIFCNIVKDSLVQ